VSRIDGARDLDRRGAAEESEDIPWWVTQKEVTQKEVAQKEVAQKEVTQKEVTTLSCSNLL